MLKFNSKHFKCNEKSLTPIGIFKRVKTKVYNNNDWLIICLHKGIKYKCSNNLK